MKYQFGGPTDTGYAYAESSKQLVVDGVVINKWICGYKKCRLRFSSAQARNNHHRAMHVLKVEDD